MYDVGSVMRQMARFKRQRDLVNASLVVDEVKKKLLADLDEQERKLAATIIETPKGAK